MAARRYADPYFAGVALGVVLLAAFVLVGRGLGASGAFASVAAAGAAAVQENAAANPALAPYLARGVQSPLTDWLVLQVAGLALGAFVSAWRAGRLTRFVMPGSARAVAAVAGGLLMGVGAKFARGCTSGQALTGGALLSVGAWLFIAACFAAGFAFAPAVKRLWP